MNTSSLRTKRVLLPAALLTAVAVGGGVFWAASASADDLSGTERDRVSAAAVTAAGGGQVTSAESSDDPGEAYEVEVRQTDGTEVDVTLDDQLAVVRQDTDRPDGGDGRDDDRREDGTPDADDRVLSTTERAAAEKAALAAVGSGRVTDVDATDDRGAAYDVEVLAADGTEWDVDLDAAYDVVRKVADR